MDSNRNWVQVNLERQKKILEEKQKQRRLQSAGIVRSTISSTQTSTLFSQPVNIFNTSIYDDNNDNDDDKKSTNSIEIKVKQTKLDDSWLDDDTINNSTIDTLSTTLNTTTLTPTTTTKDISTISTPEPSPIPSSSTDILSTPVNSDTEQNDKLHDDIKPWQDENKLEESVLEDVSNIDITKVVTDLKTFVTEPVKRGVTMRCTITRDKKGVEKGWYPSYYLHWEKDGDKRFFLLAARRRKKCVTGSYLMSIDPTEMSREGKSFVGKVRSNAVGTFFTVYDNGCNPKKSANIDTDIRQELVGIIYEKNVFGWNGPRKMTILIPGMQGEEMNERREIRPISEKDSLIERYKTGKTNEMIILHNKAPMWSEETQSFVLNFRGRVTQASVKNFQIIHDGNPEYIVLQFGRTNDSTFTLDFRYPLTPLQAFGIAMSSFHGKLACE